MLFSNYQNEAAYHIAEVHYMGVELDHAFQWLETPCTRRDAGLSAILAAPLLKSLHANPRCAAFLKKIRLA